MNLIKQITIGDSGAQTIKMVVKSNERGPQGAQGVPGDAATLEAGNAYSIPEGQNPQVINTGTSSNAVFDFYLPKGPRGDDGKDGKDGAIHYTAGTGINITDSNVIEATGAAIAAWGGIQGDIEDQTDLQNALQNTASTAETASKNYTDTKLEDYAKTTDIPTVNNATLTIQNNGTNVATFTANSSTNATANIVPPVQIGSVLSTPTSVAYVNTANIIDGAVTSNKIAWSTATSTIVTPSATFGFGTIANSRKMHIWNFGPIVMLQGQLQATQDIASGYTEICSFSTDYNPVGGGTLTFMDTTSSSQPIRFDISNGHLYSADRAYSNGEIVRLSLVWHK